MIDLEYLTNKSGDSIIEEYSYSGGILIMILSLTEIDKKFKLIIKSGDLSFDCFYLEHKEELYRTCRIEIQELSKVISVENGIYVPPALFGKVIQESKSNYNLAYGKQKSKVKYIFSLTGYGKLMSCLISDTNSIIIEELN